jgi:hypothetical protein
MKHREGQEDEHQEEDKVEQGEFYILGPNWKPPPSQRSKYSIIENGPFAL